MDRTHLLDDDRDAMETADSRHASEGEIDYGSLLNEVRQDVAGLRPNFEPVVTEKTERRAPSASFARSLRGRKVSRISEEIFEQIAIERSEIAFREFYERISPKVYVFLYRLLKTEDDALDILQDVFAELWNKAPVLYNIHTNLAAWSLHLARNLAISELRSRHHKNRDQTESFEPERHENLFLDERTPEGELTQIEAKAEVKKALEKLSPDQRKGIEMVFFGGLSRKAAAEKLQLPYSQFQGIFSDTLAELEHALFPLLGDKKAPQRPPSKLRLEREEQAERAAAIRKFIAGVSLGDA